MLKLPKVKMLKPTQGPENLLKHLIKATDNILLAME